MKYLSLFIILILSFKLNAQLDKILKNKDIVWAAEVTTDLVLDDANMAYDSAINYLYTLKYTPYKFNQVNNDDREYLSSQYSNFHNNKINTRVDSVTVIDPKTKETKLMAVASNYFGDLKFWRLKEIIFYNFKLKSWDSYVISFKPITTKKDWETGLRNEFNEGFNIENKKPNLNSKNITWAKRTATRLKGGNHLCMDSVKILKNTADPMALFFNDFENNAKNTYYNDASLIENNKLTPSVRKALLRQRDTITAINPTTREEELKVANSDILPADIRNLRLVHDWYWDNKKQRLYVRLTAVAPMKEEFMNGEFMFERPLFYQKY